MVTIIDIHKINIENLSEEQLADNALFILFNNKTDKTYYIVQPTYFVGIFDETLYVFDELTQLRLRCTLDKIECICKIASGINDNCWDDKYND